MAERASGSYRAADGEVAMASADRQSFVRRLLGKRLAVIGLAGVALVLLVAIAGPLLAPHDPAEMSPHVLQAPSEVHWMGTDAFGRDTLSRFLYGTRVSILVAFTSVAGSLCIGTLLGMLAGAATGRAWDNIIMRFMDVILAFPLLVLVPVITGIVGAGELSVAGVTLGPMPLVASAIGVALIPLFARVARASVLAEMREDYILAARSFGARRRDIFVSNLLPNIAAPLVVQAAFVLAVAISVEAAVSFLGLGVKPPEVSWGTMLSEGRQYIALGAWWLALFPSIAIALTVLSVNLLGDTLRDELDPRFQTR